MTHEFGKVGILYGGHSAERTVSLQSGEGVLSALQSKGIDAHLFDTGKQSLAELAAQNFDRVFIALHGRYGEDGTLQGALELLGIPYTGSGVMASSLAMNKIMTKRVWLEQGLPTPRYKVVRNLADTDAACAELGLPLILKAPHEGSTLGLYKVSEPDELHEAFRQVINFDHELLAEQFVVGRELTIPVVGKGEDARALPVIEILPQTAIMILSINTFQTIRVMNVRPIWPPSWPAGSRALPYRPIGPLDVKDGRGSILCLMPKTSPGCLKSTHHRA